MPVNTKAATQKSTDPCYKITPPLTKANWNYPNEIYREKYPDLGLTCWYTSEDDQTVLKKLV